MEEQDLIEKYGVEDIADAVRKAYDAALHAKLACEEKRWRWTFHRKEIVLRDEAEKVIKCINMLKTAGDAAAGLDPIHAGLPWALINTLFKVITADHTQMAALLTGMGLALSMANRLQAYLRFCQQLPQNLTTENLEEALIKTYTHILQFLVLAMQTYDRNTTARTIGALWKTSTLEDFKGKCNELGAQAEIEASNCDRELRNHDHELAKQLESKLNDALSKLQTFDDVKASMESLNIKVDLKGLETAEGAMFDSHKDEHEARCLKGTRVELLQQIDYWSHDPDGKSIFWLCGKAGTGKSTIARTVGHNLDGSGRLGASFFFKRGEADRGRAGRFFPTIVKQLIDRMPDASKEIAAKAITAALEADSLLCQKSLQQQFERLLLTPFSSLDTTQVPFQDYAIVIDALDECERDNDVRTILKLFSRTMVIGPLRLKIFVTSRPDLPLLSGFQSMNGDLHQDVMLEEVQATSIRQDIRLYYEHRLKDIRETAEDPDSLSYDWPGEDKVVTLVDLAVPLFIFASTVCRYVEEGDPKHCLDTILVRDRSRSISGLEDLYLPILQHKISGRTPPERKQALSDFKTVVGTIVLLADPLSVASLSGLLDLPKSRIKNTLKNLHSLLSISPEVPIRPLHLSFRDFLLESNGMPAGDYHIEEAQTHAILADKCLHRLQDSERLRKNICSLTEPGVRRIEIGKEKIEGCIPADIAYACSYWVLHVVEGRKELRDDDQVHRFLRDHFLHWLEALSWLGRLSSAVPYIRQLHSCVKVRIDMI